MDYQNDAAILIGRKGSVGFPTKHGCRVGVHSSLTHSELLPQ